MRIYGNLFEYEIIDGILTLKSETTNIIAVRDKSTQNILNRFK